MALRRLAEDQPETFSFTPENRRRADREIAKFPPGRQHSAVLALLWEAQRQHGGWLPEPAIRHVAEILDMPLIRALEIATFYTMFNLAPVGRKAHIQVCGTTPCMLRGAEALKEICRVRINHHQGEPSPDGAFSWVEIECAGACVNAPMVQIGSDNFEDLTPATFDKLIDDLAAGRAVRPGPQINRQNAAPVGGATTLTDPALYATRGTPAAPSAAPTATAVPESAANAEATPKPARRRKSAATDSAPSAPPVEPPKKA